MTSVSSQGTLNSLSDRFGGKIPVRIFFLDNSSKMFLLSAGTAVQTLIRLILEKLESSDPDRVLTNYGLYISQDGSNIDHCLSMEESVTAAIESWENESNSKILFMIRLYMDAISGFETIETVSFRLNRPKNLINQLSYLETMEVISESSLNLQYLQAVYNVITGQYPCDVEEALKLGAIHFIYKFGEYQPMRHRPGFLGRRIVEFIPTKLLKSKGFEQWEQLLFDNVRDYYNSNHGNKLDGINIKSPQHAYLRRIMNYTDHFGVTFFRVSQNCTKLFPEKVILGICAVGLNIYDRQRKIIKKFKLEEIFRWGFKTKVLFYFEVRMSDQEDLTMFDFDSMEGQTIADLLTDYALTRVKEIETGASDVDFTDSTEHCNLDLKPFPPTAPEISNDNDDDVVKMLPIICREEQLPEMRCIQSNDVFMRAVVRIQAVLRGTAARVKVTKMIEEMFESGELSVGSDEGTDVNYGNKFPYD